MADTAELCEVLEDSLENGTRVQVIVTECEYRCCGGGWSTRNYGLPTRYKGRVLSINVDEFLLQVTNEIGKGAEIIAKFSDLRSAAPLVD